MEIWKLSEKVSEISDVIPYYFFSLFLSCISFSVVIIVFSGEPNWLRVLPVIIYSFYVVIPYLLFAVPLQIIFNKRPRKFNVIYLLIYMVLSLVAVFLFNVMLFSVEPTYLVKTQLYYGLSFAAAAIYWFWDSVFLQNQLTGA
ncbi:UPF0715 family protein [Peribacillus butanolivorans]|uniref:UPF0715 family protein n=1 Tax=Peribacillus butanolivorans TaxID=421767 RepID=UPI00207CAAA7|nr:UPF0715 family protein [Peribacillus butanolivorans]MCO0601242.1 UPF0715 family protein [Peribacillus butanolivorans]